jgi:MFS transporter, DHA2 family, multidrug resistance protein
VGPDPLRRRRRNHDAGFLTGRFGVKRLFKVSVAGFTIVSMLCGLAGSLIELVVFRLLQGAFGAALVPLS